MADVKVLGHCWFTGVNGETLGIVVTHNGYEEKAYIGSGLGLSEEADITRIREQGGKVYPVSAAKIICGIPVDSSTAWLAMEWGFKAHERGLNLEGAKLEFQKVLRGN